MTNIVVDGQEYEVKAGVNVLEALLSIGINVPYFCWHPAMGSVGACRQCAVLQYANKEDDRGRIVMSCMTPVSDGAIFSVNAENASEFRSSVIENLMLNHPHDCPVCEEGGECHLQDMTVMVGHNKRQYEGKKTTFRNQYLGPFIGHEMNRCITCYRCVRFYQDYAGGDDLGAFASRDRVFFGRAEEGILENEFAGNLVEVCPTGVFTDKTLSKNYTRKWDLQSAPTICVGCSLGCNTHTSERYGEIRRVHNRYHSEVNGYFLCDRGRFGAGFVSSQERIKQAGIRREDGLYDEVDLSSAVQEISDAISISKRTIGIGSPRASVESNFALRALVGEENYCNGMSNVEREMHEVILSALNSNLSMPSIAEVEEYDAVLVLGEDVTNHAPRLALSIRQAVRNKSTELASAINLSPWQDAAVRELAQDSLSPLALVTPMKDRLDSVASQVMRINSEEIAEFGFEIASCLDTVDSSHSENKRAENSAALEQEVQKQKVEEVCALLIKAKKPLVISGTSLQNPDVLKASVNIALALQNKNASSGLFLCASECNSVGVAALDNKNSMESLVDEQPDCLIVLENDLSQTLGQEFKEKLQAIKKLVVVDHLDNQTVSLSDIVLPAATFAEADGTYINTEGRAQRSMAVFSPNSDFNKGNKSNIHASFHLLDAIAGQSRDASQILRDMVDANPHLSKVVDAAPDTNFRIQGSKSSRMTHRSSGRTAMLADVSVHEPQQAIDNDSALSFSMEGVQQEAPSSLRAFTWSPGWNSNQSIHKFQAEVGGEDKQGNAGSLVFAKANTLVPYSKTVQVRSKLIAKHHIFGSEALSSHSPEIETLMPLPYLMMNDTSAKQLQVKSNDGLQYQLGDVEIQFAVLVDDDIPDGCLVYPIIPETRCLINVDKIELSPIVGFVPKTRSPNLIATDRVS
jgi:NADH-quinone oxidoreductase subunit G